MLELKAGAPEPEDFPVTTAPTEPAPTRDDLSQEEGPGTDEDKDEDPKVGDHANDHQPGHDGNTIPPVLAHKHAKPQPHAHNTGKKNGKK